MLPPHPPLQAQVETHNDASQYTHHYASLQPEHNPPVFFRETFKWKNTADPKGWTAPEGFYFEDPNDTGLNWQWWPNDSMVSQWIGEPPFQSTSRDDGHLCLFGALYNNDSYPTYSNLRETNNSIVFPAIDCSQHTSVILQFETNFKNMGAQRFVNLRGGWRNTVEVSPDDGIHWTRWDAGFGVPGEGRPNDVAPGQVVFFRENISEVAAGQSRVRIRITWYNYFGLYFWNIDDLQLSEALPNDLRLDSIDIQWDNKIVGTTESISYMMPVSQLGKGHSFELFKSKVTNMGATTATNIVFDVTIKHEDDIVFQETRTRPSLLPGYKDSFALDGQYVPVEKGKYSIQYKLKQDQKDDFQEDNDKTFYYFVSDSIYNRAGDQPDNAFSYNSLQFRKDEWSLYANVNHFMGSVFPIYGNCEIDGISAYIMGGLADGLIDFGFTVWQADYYAITTGIIDPKLLMKTERLYLDSTMFNTWVYLPFSKNGEDEFIQAGSLLWAGVEYSNWHPVESVRRYQGLSIGETKQTPYHDARVMLACPNSMVSTGIGWSYYPSKNLMVRLYLHDNSSSTGPEMAGNSLILTQNYPNPFTGQTVINYQIGTDSPVRLEITDLTGRKVMVREEGPKPPGRHQILIEGTGLAPGVYFYTVYAGANRETKRMMVLDK